jgi:putative CocE/NonD family hydrolase
MTELPFGVPLPETPPRETFEEQLKTRVEQRQREVGIPMRDGIELAADLHLPAGDEPAPAIVIGHPYDKSGTSEPALRDAGYVVVVYDCRGRCKSEGEFRAMDPQEWHDGHDVVEWVARQPWCDGRVAVTGLSYGGWLVWATAKERPRHLRAAISLSAAGRWQQEIPYTYGCFQLYWVMWFSVVRRRLADRTRKVSDLIETLPIGSIGDALNVTGRTWQDLMEHEGLDDFWQARRWDGAYDFDLPCLHITGWFDREDIQGAFHHYEQMIETSAARDQQWLVVGPWSHVSTSFPSAAYSGIQSPDGGVDMDAIRVRFFDHFLRGANDDLESEPRVWLYDTGAGAWGRRDRWMGSTEQRALFLGADNRLAESADDGGTVSYRYDPLDAPGIRFDIDAIWEPPLQLNDFESQPGVVSWTSDEITEGFTVHGWSTLELWAATDGDDTEWHVKLADVEPDGAAICVAWGCLKASHGADPANPAPVVPGSVERYEIELTPAFHSFRPGHRVRLVVASADYPWFARNLNRFGPIKTLNEPRVAVNTIHFGTATPSALRLRTEVLA